LAVVQTIGGALLVSAAQAAFVNTLVSQVLINSPGINPALVVAAGATGLRDAFTEAQLPKILLSYMAALRVAYSISIATGGAAALVALLAPWRSIKGRVSMAAA
jgi:MFS transporter, DHA2 family, glioxin efflux transporter